ncbi:hypothetical protein V511_05715 [Mesotoga sp. Brook.08.YT.4.2.5.1]|nr:hypothetical protein V511_05715 [Mesotoga sp. Brook.08.YT.4.2.5.1]PNQ04569.1 hypothetical protein RM69_07975 [Mesotoga sp. SC_NapDC3]PXF33709.1 hypothetical protein EU77_12085 [Mesotoga sp. SC_NapDC]RAO96113.1 hypothetical protein M388_03375 [Mesotoga sp. Brook.08.YT.4.2.5.4.]RDI90732.1 hypothetical protein Q502_13020 [Mesotoga sp. Brook.08.YT.4.2.5.2.]
MSEQLDGNQRNTALDQQFMLRETSEDLRLTLCQDQKPLHLKLKRSGFLVDLHVFILMTGFFAENSAGTQ